MRASRSQMAGAFILLAGAAAVPARAYLTSQADALAPDLLSDREGAVDHPTRPRHLARSDESRGSKRISMSHARSHDLERSDETPRDQRCTELIDGTSCPASIPDKTCNRHYLCGEDGTSEATLWRGSDKYMRAAALTISINALECADDYKKRHRMFMRTITEKRGAALRFASDGLKGDLEFVTMAVLNDPAALTYASDEFKQSRKRMLDLLTHIRQRAQNTKAEEAYGKVATLRELLQYSGTSGAFQQDVRMLGRLASHGPRLLSVYASGLSNPDFMIDAASVNGDALQYIRDATVPQDQQESYWRRLVDHFGIDVLEYAGEPQIQQVSFWLSIVQHFGIDALVQARRRNADILSDVRSMTELARVDIRALRYASDELLADRDTMTALAEELGNEALDYEIVEEIADPEVEQTDQSAVQQRKVFRMDNSLTHAQHKELPRKQKRKSIRTAIAHSRLNKVPRFMRFRETNGESGHKSLKEKALFEKWRRFFDQRPWPRGREGALFAKWVQYYEGTRKLTQKEKEQKPPSKVMQAGYSKLRPLWKKLANERI